MLKFPETFTGLSHRIVPEKFGALNFKLWHNVRLKLFTTKIDQKQALTRPIPRPDVSLEI